MLQEKLRDCAFVLGSGSPRRQQLLAELGINFSIRVADTDEIAPPGLTGEETATFIAQQKANALIGNLQDNEVLLTADTEVWQNRLRFGKPTNLDEARKMLQLLSGSSHQVISGVCISSTKKQTCFTVVTEVFMRDLANEEIEYYLKNGNPLDKAGAYGIQEWIGLVGIARINGSYTNVVGLPVAETYAELMRFLE